MGFLSKVKRAVGGAVAKLPGGSQIQKIVARDPVAQTVMKYDPIARDIAGNAGLIAPSNPVVQSDPATQVIAPAAPMVRQRGWQEDRIAAMRAKFSQGRTTPPVPAASISPPTPSAVATAPRPRTQVVVQPVPVNPAQLDVDSYSQAWSRTPQ